jgi:hypothetical protein
MSESRLLRDIPLATWLALVVAAGLSWWLGADHGLGAGDGAVIAVVVLGVGKAWLVGRVFMELHAAPSLLRRLFDAWAAATAGTLVVLLLVL